MMGSAISETCSTDEVKKGQYVGASRKIGTLPSRFSFQRGGITLIPQKSTPARPARRVEGWLRRRLVEKDSCLFQRRPAAALRRRRQLSVARGYLPKWLRTRRGGRFGEPCRAI